MNTNYDEFVRYYLQTCLTWEELTDKKARRKNNNAMDKVISLEKKMLSEPDRSANVVLRLLKHEDERVRMGAGCYCIKAQVHVEKGKQALTEIKNSSFSKYMRFIAGNNMDYCTPFSINQDTINKENI